MHDILLSPLRLNELETLIQNSVRKALAENCKQTSDSQPEPDQLLTIQQAAELLHLSIPTIYSLCSRSELPVSKRGKRLYFSKQELLAWIKGGRKKTVSEIEAEAQTYLSNRKRK